MPVLQLLPACKDYIWGGHRLVDEYGVNFNGPVLAEAWMLSCHPDGPSTIACGPYQGKTLQEYIDEQGFGVLGKNCERFLEFPILTKLIDARNNLSIQVHPDNAYALKNEGQYGKTEMWYVLDAKPGSFLYYGFKEEISKEEFEQRIQDDTLLEVLGKKPVKKGDVLFIEAGTLHAIGEGILIAEIQQNSNVTYRIYDYGRKGKDGLPRQLHVAQALDVTKREPVREDGKMYPHIADCDYFTVDHVYLDGTTLYKTTGMVNEDSFLSILVLDGQGTLKCDGDKVLFKKGDSLFLPANSGKWSMKGNCDVLLTTIRKKENGLQVAFDVANEKMVVDNEEYAVSMDSIKDDIMKHIEMDRLEFVVLYNCEDENVRRNIEKEILCPVRFA